MIPVLPFIALAIYVAFQDAYSAVHFINGHPDDAPIRSAAIALVLSPFAYVGLLTIHCICLAFQRRLSCGILRIYLITIPTFAILLALFSMIRTHGQHIANSIVFGTTISTSFLLPIALGAWALSRQLVPSKDT